MIPKIIHYCWYGHNPKNALIQRCIASWQNFFPDYEIREWNEENTDLEENDYIRTAYQMKKWAYVSDYVRMKVLYQYGGIYFDTDVEVIRAFPEDFFSLSAFSGIEGFNGLVNPGLVFACEKGNLLAARMLESYRQDTFQYDSVEKIKTINIRITELLEQDGYVREDKKQVFPYLVVFPSSIFCPYDLRRREVIPGPDSLTIHHYAASWLPWYRKIRFRLSTIIRRIIYRRK